jgi:RNA polymerase sigma-70 factor (ECF subfamily)
LVLKDIIEELSDAVLMAGVVRGNSVMLGQLYRRYGASVRVAICQWYPGVPHADIDDLLQEIFLGLARASKNYSEQERFKPWLFTIAYRKATDMQRSAKRRNRAEEIMVQEEENLAIWRTAADVETRDAMRRTIQKVFDLLPAALREVLFLRVVEEFTANEIGQITGLNEVTVRTRLHRARAMILDNADASLWRKLLEGGGS